MKTPEETFLINRNESLTTIIAAHAKRCLQELRHAYPEPLIGQDFTLDEMIARGWRRLESALWETPHGLLVKVENDLGRYRVMSRHLTE